MTDSTAPIVRLFAPVAVRALVSEVLSSQADAMAFSIDVTYDLNPNIAARIKSGEAFDVGITNPWYVPDLIAAQVVDASSHVAFGRFPLAVAGCGLAPKALLTSGDEICALLRGAGSIAYTADGTSGKTFVDVMRRIGVLDEIADKLVPMGPGYASVSPVASVADGRADLAIAPLTTIVAMPGVHPVAAFPGDLDTDVEMSMFLSATPTNRRHARALVQLLSDPARDAEFAMQGLTRFVLP